MGLEFRGSASRLEAIASRVEAIVTRVEAIVTRVEAIASRLEAIAIRHNLEVAKRQPLDTQGEPTEEVCHT